MNIVNMARRYLRSHDVIDDVVYMNRDPKRMLDMLMGKVAPIDDAEAYACLVHSSNSSFSFFGTDDVPAYVIDEEGVHFGYHTPYFGERYLNQWLLGDSIESPSCLIVNLEFSRSWCGSIEMVMKYKKIPEYLVKR